MKTFVIGYLDFFDNELKLEKVQAENAVDALIRYLGMDIPNSDPSVEDIKNAAFDSDICVSIMEI